MIAPMMHKPFLVVGNRVANDVICHRLYMQWAVQLEEASNREAALIRTLRERLLEPTACVVNISFCDLPPVA